MLMLPGTESNKDSVPPLSLIFIYQTRSGSAISSLGYFIPTKVPFWNTQNFGTYFWRKCPALGIKITLLVEWRLLLHSQNSPKILELAFKLSILPHSVNFWMIFICFCFSGQCYSEQCVFCTVYLRNYLATAQAETN